MDGVRVVGNNLLVSVDDSPTTTRGGILIPDTVGLSMYTTGRVVALGYLTGKKVQDRISIPGLRVGDRVLFLRALERADSNPQIAEILGRKLIRLRPADVLLVLDDEDVKQVQ